MITPQLDTRPARRLNAPAESNKVWAFPLNSGEVERGRATQTRPPEPETEKFAFPSEIESGLLPLSSTIVSKSRFGWNVWVHFFHFFCPVAKTHLPKSHNPFQSNGIESLPERMPPRRSLSKSR
jgi:hypothetical protein